MADGIHSVFVSSTYDDLREERAEVQKALLKLRCFPVGMELFPSTDEETFEFIKRQIDQCDYYIVVIAGRYGTEARDGLSYTEKEYDYARSTGKPTMAFIHGDRGTIQVAKTDKEPEKREKLEAFVAKVTNGTIVNFFVNPHDLSGKVLASLVDVRDRYPKAGFIRAEDAVDFKRYAGLLEENESLRRQIAALGAELSDQFPEASDLVPITLEIQKSGSTARTQDAAPTWGRLFQFIAKQIIKFNNSDGGIKSACAAALAQNLDEGEVPTIGKKAFEEIKQRLYGRGLVEFEEVEERVGDFSLGPYHRWHVTQFGRRQFGRMIEV